MNYIKATVYTERGACDALAYELEDLCSGLVIDDPDEISRLAASPPRGWDYVDESVLRDRRASVCFYLEEDEAPHTLAAVRERLALLSGIAFYGELRLETEPVCSEDWENQWKAYFKPFAVGSRLLVRPSWEPVVAADGRAVLTIDPAGCFGTGTHATTRLCLGLLDEARPDGARVLDVGCGSGILAIASLLLGAAHAVACDIEPSAVRTAAENLQINGFDAGRATVILGDVLTDETVGAQVEGLGPYDVVCANIVADVLMAMEPLLRGVLRPGGLLLLSGILNERAEDVRGVYLGHGFAAHSERSAEGWTALALRRI